MASRRRKSFPLAYQFPLFSSFNLFFPYKFSCHTMHLPTPYLLNFNEMLYSPSVFITPPALLTKLSPPGAQSVFSAHFEDFLENRIAFYTDASKSDPGCYVGFAVYSPNLKLIIQKKLSSHVSVFTAEAFAIYYAISTIIDRKIRSSSIFSDSLSAITSILADKAIFPTNYVVAHIRSLLFDAFSVGLDIFLIWIPAHVGIIGNETVDRLAKMAIRSGDLLKSALPSSDIATVASEKARKRTKKYLTSLFSEKGIVYFEKNLFTPEKPWFYKMSLDRCAIATVSRLRSGHCNTKTVLFRFGLIDSPMCQCGRSVENIKHIFLDCPRYELARSTPFNKLRDLNIPLTDIYPLLCKPTHAIATAIARFLHKSELRL